MSGDVSTDPVQQKMPESYNLPTNKNWCDEWEIQRNLMQRMAFPPK